MNVSFHFFTEVLENFFILKTGAKAEEIVRRGDDCLIRALPRLITGNYAIQRHEIGFASLVESSTFTISFGWQTKVCHRPKATKLSGNPRRSRRPTGWFGRQVEPCAHSSCQPKPHSESDLTAYKHRPQPRTFLPPHPSDSRLSLLWLVTLLCTCSLHIQKIVHFLANKLWAGVKPQRC